jgi:hypothetical protein
VPLAEGRRVERLLRELDSDQFSLREKAVQELEKLVELAEPALHKALAGQPTIELRRRIERLLEKLNVSGVSPERLQALRAVEVLERIGSQDARALVERLAQGAPQAWLTEEASAAVRRFDRRMGN